MRSLLAVAVVLCLGTSAYAGPLGIFGQRRSQGSQGGCANGSCGAATQSASGQFSSYQYTLQPQVVAQPQAVVVTPGQVARAQAVRQAVQPQVAGAMPENVLITTDPPARPTKITFNGVDYFPRH